MTLIASMRAKFGAMILSDTQETVGEYKYAVLKSSPVKVKGFDYVIAGGGDGEAIDELSEEFERALRKSNCKSLDSFRALLEKQIDLQIRYLRTIKEPHAQFELIVAATKNKKWQVWKNCRKTLVPTNADYPVLVGFDAEIYKHVGRTLYPHAKSTSQIALVGLRILEMARQSSTCVNAPYSGVLVTPDGIWNIDSDVLAELTESVSSFGSAFDNLLLACSDTSIREDEFSKLLGEFTANVIQLRKDYQQSMAEKDFAVGLKSGFGCGLPVLPSNSIRSAGLDVGGWTVSVTELPKAPKQSGVQKSKGQQ